MFAKIAAIIKGAQERKPAPETGIMRNELGWYAGGLPMTPEQREDASNRALMRRAEPTKTMRDEIAIAAMQALMAKNTPWERVPELAYMMADRMMEGSKMESRKK